MCLIHYDTLPAKLRQRHYRRSEDTVTSGALKHTKGICRLVSRTLDSRAYSLGGKIGRLVLAP